MGCLRARPHSQFPPAQLIPNGYCSPGWILRELCCAQSLSAFVCRSVVTGSPDLTVVLPCFCLKMFNQVLHSNATGQEPRSFGLHQCECALASPVDSHDSPQIHHKLALGVSMAGLLPVRSEVPNPRFRKPSLENQLLFRRSVDFRDP